MLAYSRGSNTLAGAASLKHRMPAMIGAIRSNRDIAQWQSNSLTSCGTRVRLSLSASLLKTASQPSEPGVALAACAR